MRGGALEEEVADMQEARGSHSSGKNGGSTQDEVRDPRQALARPTIHKTGTGQTDHTQR